MTNTLPPILDFEASSLSDSSYPITAGLVVNGEINYWIIRPQADWIDWSFTSQCIHGIQRSFLMEHGVSVPQVREELKILIGDNPAVYSDNPYWESRWLGCLGEFDFDVRDIRELLDISLQEQFPTNLERQFTTLQLTRHRADHDAYAMYLCISELRGLNLKL